MLVALSGISRVISKLARLLLTQWYILSLTSILNWQELVSLQQISPACQDSTCCRLTTHTVHTMDRIEKEWWCRTYVLTMLKYHGAHPACRSGHSLWVNPVSWVCSSYCKYLSYMVARQPWFLFWSSLVEVSWFYFGLSTVVLITNNIINILPSFCLWSWNMILLAGNCWTTTAREFCITILNKSLVYCAVNVCQVIQAGQLPQSLLMWLSAFLPAHNDNHFILTVSRIPVSHHTLSCCRRIFTSITSISLEQRNVHNGITTISLRIDAN